VLYTAGFRSRYENPRKIWELRPPNPYWV